MIDRRTFIATVLVAAVEPLSPHHARAQGNASQAGVSKMTAYAFSFPALSGADIRLAEFTGRPMLIVNTASQCGYTPQYAGLQELWGEFRDRGLVIIATPSNDFGGQEPGSAKEIAETAQQHYGVTFPVAGKVAVKGPSAHPFYRWAADARPREVPRWNFHKYLIGREGYISEVFAENIEPMDTRVKTAIARALAVS
jgi:glutathione peroxidase